MNIKEKVLAANLKLVEYGLVTFTWGNVSQIERGSDFVVIKPSGVTYENMGANDMAVVSLAGERAGGLKPSSDTPTHLVLYRAFSEIGGVVHTHSPWATTFAQAGLGIPVFGTTHADYFYGEIPCVRALTTEEIKGDYEAATGRVIVETFHEAGLCPKEMPGVLVHGHGPFAWGRDAEEAVFNAVVLERVAEMAWRTLQLNPKARPISRDLLDKHFLRKHGSGAYYGQ